MTSGSGRHRGTIENRSMTGGGDDTRADRTLEVEKDFFSGRGESSIRFRFFDRLIGNFCANPRVFLDASPGPTRPSTDLSRLIGRSFRVRTRFFAFDSFLIGDFFSSITSVCSVVNIMRSFVSEFF